MSNNPNPFNNASNTPNMFTNPKPTGNQPGGLFANNNTGQNGGNPFVNNQGQSNASNSFGAPQNQQPSNNPPTNNLFGQGNQSNNSTVSLFGNKAPENKPQGGGLFNNGQNNQPQQNTPINPVTNNQPPANQGAPGIFANNAANQQQSQGNNPTGPSGFGANLGNKPPQFPSSTGGNMFAGNNAQNNAGNQPQNSSAQQPPANNLFTGNKPAVNLMGQKPTENQHAGQTAQGNKPPAQNPPANNLFPNNTATSNTGGGLFGNNATNTGNQQPVQQPAQQNTSQPATGATGGNLLGGNKMTTSATVPPQQPANNLFNNAANNNNAQNNQTQNAGQQQQNTPAGQQQNNPGSQGQQQGQNPGQQQSQPQSQQGPTFGNQQQQSNPSQSQSRRNPAEVEFERKGTKTVEQFINESRSELDQIYCDLLKCSNNLIRYQETREENHTIFKNFEQLKPQFTNTYNNNLEALLTIKHQQDEIEKSISMIYEALRPERYEHPLISCMEECHKLSSEIVQLQMDNDKQNQMKQAHPSHEQLMLMYASLDKIETDVDNMNELLEICFPQNLNNQNDSYQGNYRNGYGNRYRENEI